LPGRAGLVPVPVDDDAMRLTEQALEKWRAAAAAAALWEREDSREARCYSRIFAALLEAAWCDMDALEWCVGLRLTRAAKDGKAFGPLANESRQRILQSQPLFSGEKQLLQDILKATKSVAEPHHSRIEKIVSLLKERTASDSRFVVFPSSPALADQLYISLSRAMSFPVLRHSGEDSRWRSFQGSASGILVCDFRGEEGLNLQGGKACMFHADLPLSPNRLEQRTGRLDRFGVGTAVTSFALQPAECAYCSEWSKSLTNIYQVFSRSIAALQYVVEDETKVLESRLLLDGAGAFAELNERLGGDKGLLEKELKAILAQDELNSIEVVTSSTDDDLTDNIEKLEIGAGTIQACAEAWLQGRLKFVHVGETAIDDNVVRYHFVKPGSPRASLLSRTEFARWFGRAVDRETRHSVFPPPLTWPLSYLRETARCRNVGLGRVGNTVIDALHDYLRWDDRGTCFAFWRFLPGKKGTAVDLFFRFDFVIEAELSNTEQIAADFEQFSRSAVLRRGDAAFPPIARTVWLTQDLFKPAENVRAELERPYVKGPADTNINYDRWAAVERHLKVSDWPNKCRYAHAAARDALMQELDLTALTSARAKQLAQETALVVQQCESRIEAVGSFSQEALLAKQDLNLEIRLRELLLNGVTKPRIRLDAAGAVFLAGIPLVDSQQ